MAPSYNSDPVVIPWPRVSTVLDQPTRWTDCKHTHWGYHMLYERLYMQSHEMWLSMPNVVQICQTWPRSHTSLMNHTLEGCHIVWRFDRQTSPTWLIGVEGRCIVLYPGRHTCPQVHCVFISFHDSVQMFISFGAWHLFSFHHVCWHIWCVDTISYQICFYDMIVVCSIILFIHLAFYCLTLVQ